MKVTFEVGPEELIEYQNAFAANLTPIFSPQDFVKMQEKNFQIFSGIYSGYMEASKSFNPFLEFFNDK